ncbi:MAG: ABC transporter substrate-binding protein [Anaerolineaceae bacterium]|nr:ABC transporter substrate-binding protein [Anaerolineaceae bacterium]
MKKSIALLMSFVILLTLLAGCAGNNPATGNNANTVTDAQSGTTTENNEAQDAVSEAEARTDIIIAIDTDVATLHPTDTSTSNEMDIDNQIYDPLMFITLDGSTTPEPRIAASYEISEDGLTYTFHLRDDVTFHDGSPLTAEDVKFSAELYEQSIYQNARVTGMKEIEIIDDYTIAFTTETVYSPFFENIVDMHIASKAYYESVSAEVFASDPIGSGPYKFVSHELGSKIVLEAYDAYYLGKAGITNITFKILSDNATVAVAMQTGEIDFASISESNFSNLEDVEGIVIETVPMSRFGFVAMNHEKYPFSETKFRQAVAYAIDRQNMVDLALDGFGTPNSNILSPLRFGYSETQPVYDYNPEKSEALLEELGITTPYDLGTMYVAESYSTQAQILQNDLSNIGLNITLEILEFNAYLDKLLGGDYGISVLAMSLEGNTQEFELAFKSDYIGAANNARYSNPEIEKLFDDAVAAVDENERYDIYNQIFTKVQEDAVYVIMYNTEGLYAHSDALTCHPFALEGRYYVYDFAW